MCLEYKPFEITVKKAEIARNEHFFHFPQCFLPIWITFCHFNKISNWRLQTLSVWKSLIFVVWERVNAIGDNFNSSPSNPDWLIDWMVFYATFNNISVISRQQLTLFMSFQGYTSTRLGLWSVLPKDTPMKKTRGSSAAWTQDPWITSQNTAPLSHASFLQSV